MSMEWTNQINTEEAAAMEEAQQRIEARRKAREKRHRRKRIIETTILAALTLCLGIIIGVRINTESRELQTEPPAQTIPPTAISIHTPDQPEEARAGKFDGSPIEPERPEPDDAEIIEATPTLLPSIPLDKEIQMAIYEICEGDNELFCAAMAIAYKESRFDPEAIGDNGRSIGMMQINQRWHTERMERLGVTDLLNPIQNAAVGIDCLKELSSTFGWVDGEKVYMAYNAGCGQASEWIKDGIVSTEYSRDTINLYRNYLTEMEAQ